MRDGWWRRSRGRTRRAPTTLIRLLSAAVAALLLTCWAGTGTPPASAQVAAPAEVTLQNLTPSVADPDSTVEIEGTVRNVSSRPLVRLQVTLWRHLVPLTTESELDSINVSTPDYPVGERMYLPETPDAYQDLYTEAEPELAPGESRQFRVRAEATDFFRGNPQDGVYLVGVQVRENAAATVGRARTYLPAQSTDTGSGQPPGQTTLDSSTLVKLASTPSMVRPDVFADDDLADELAAGGRLDTLLSAAAEPGVSFAVDPSLIAEVRSMRDGYDVLLKGGKTTDGSGSRAAQDWLRRFDTLLAEQDGFRLPYADLDLGALIRAGRSDIAEDGERQAERVTGVGDLPLLVAPPGGSSSSAVLDAADRLDAAAVLLSDTTVAGLGPVVRATQDGPTILSYDTEPATLGPGPPPRTTPIQVQQTALADSYLGAISGQDPAALGRLTYITEPTAAGQATARPPWEQARPVSELLTDDPARLTGGLRGPDTAETELTGRQVDRILALEDNLGLYRELLARPGSTDAWMRQAVVRASSSSWRDRPTAMIGYVNDQQRLLTSTRGKLLPLSALRTGRVVNVQSNPQVTLTGSSAGIPVTVVNNLNSTIRVRLLSTSQNTARLQLEEPDSDALDAVEPGARVPAQITARASANGTVPITVQLATTSGTPIGEPLPIRVNATQAGRIGWVIAVAAGAVLLLTVVLRIRQVARERAADGPAAGDTGTADTGSDPAGSDRDGSDPDGSDRDGSDLDGSDRDGHDDDAAEPSRPGGVGPGGVGNG